MTTTKKQAKVQDYQTAVYDMYNEHGYYPMGSFASFTWRDDPRHLLFSMARYKFCSKMLAGKASVVEVGCGDAFCMPLMLQTVGHVHGVDTEPTIIEENLAKADLQQRCSFEVLDATQAPTAKQHDAAYSLDVIEHIPSAQEQAYMANIAKSLKPQGVCIIGTPNVTATCYASDISNAAHVNLKGGEQLKELAEDYYHNVFLFSMSDEVVHTGYTPMAHYLLVMGVGVKNRD